jgi:2-desacetyl-2-hydroxyethyl bacteriochlorophyllide A dehydrogenase
VKAIRIQDGEPVVVDVGDLADISGRRPGEDGDEFRVRVAAVGICGSDLHLIDTGLAEGRVLGHEISGHLDDGTAVAIEPFRSCGHCGPCTSGDRHRCADGADIIGIVSDGGMAEFVTVPAAALVKLPTGIDVAHASLVENLAVGVHALNRARVRHGDRVAVVGAGPIGLATTAVLVRAGFDVAIGARHDHQRLAAETLGATVLDDSSGGAGGFHGFDVVFDAVGTTDSLRESVRRVAHGGRICMVGSFWDPVEIDVGILMQEAELIPAMMYGRTPNGREIDGAAALLAELPRFGDTMISHRFPLDGASEAFAAARDRSSGAIKVVFEPGI